MKLKIIFLLFMTSLPLIAVPLWSEDIKLVKDFEYQINMNKIKNMIHPDYNSPNVPITGCSVFTVEVNGTVYFANNEDETGARKNTRIWFVPADDNSTYGTAYLGFCNNLPGANEIDGIAIGGINTQGLCFDANGIPLGNVTPNNDGPARNGISNWEVILRECASVDEVIQWHLNHNMGGYWGNQVHWADASGDAVVIGPGGPDFDNQLEFTHKVSEYLISTNFNLAGYNLTNPNTSYPCERYLTIKTQLDSHLSNDELTLESMRDILELVHFPRSDYYIGTAYSNIYDLKTLEIYLYIWGDFSEVHVLNLEKELKKGAHEMRITIENDFSSKSAIGFEILQILISIVPLAVLYKKKTAKTESA